MIGTTTAILAASAMAAGGSVLGAKMGAKAQKDSAAYAADLQNQQYQQSREDLAPFREAGQGAVHQMSGLLQPGGFVDEKFTGENLADDPGVAFRLTEGQKALERSASARGSVLGGGALKSLAQYSQGLASQEYNNAYNRWNEGRTQKWNMLTGVANLGAGSTAQTVAAGTHAADAAGEAAMGAGNATAAGWMATGNAIGSSANSISQYYAMRDLFKPQPTTVPRQP